MNDWVIYAVLGMLQVGLMMALFKVPAAKKINKYGITAWSYFFAILVAGAILFNYIVLDIRTLILSFLWGAGFATVTLVQMHTLHKHDTSKVFPFTSLASNILVVIGGVLFLNEVISLLQWVAISISIILFTAAFWGKKMDFALGILPSFAFIAILSTFNKFVQKVGADSVEIYNFIFWQLFFALITSVVIMFYTKKETTLSDLVHRHLLKWAVLIGVLQFGTTFTITKALSVGPISMIHIVLGLYTVFTTIFAALLFKEKITRKAVLFILFSFLVVLLIKLG